jgi:glycerophosphoryl diester phosphodiesterase
MRVPLSVEKLFHQIVDKFYAKWPQPVPSEESLRNCKIVSHRGEHDNIKVFENTLKAFDAAQNCGIWGIELDIRWTKDFHPVVFHDKDLRRIFGSSLEISRTTRKKLRKSFPEVPYLEEVVNRYGKKMHLMAELKEEVYPDPAFQTRRLSQIFSQLIPEMDYHFLSLVPAMFRFVDFVPNSTYLIVSQLNLSEMSRNAIQHGYKGVAGHYLFVTRRVVALHKINHQVIATGYIRSKNSLFRELGRGVDWVFSNEVHKLQRVLEEVTGISSAGHTVIEDRLDL